MNLHIVFPAFDVQNIFNNYFLPHPVDLQINKSWKDYVQIHFTNGKNLLVKQTISAIENLLSDHMFLRVHRSYIISLNKISGYNSTSLRLGSTEIPVGRLYKQNVSRELQRESF